MKNILAENLLRFGVKNLKEKDRAVLSEALLLEQIQLVDAAVKALNTLTAKNPLAVGGEGGGGTAKFCPTISIRYVPANPGQDANIKGGIQPAEIRTGNLSGAYVIAKTNKITNAPGTISGNYSVVGTVQPKKEWLTLLNTDARPYSVGLFSTGQIAPVGAKQANMLTKDELKNTIIAHLAKFYNPKSVFNNVSKADMMAVTNVKDTNMFSSAIDTLINALDALRIPIVNKTDPSKVIECKIFQA
jgi:hypothetical protein